MQHDDADIELDCDELLGDVPRIRSITENQGFIPESWFFWRRWTEKHRRGAKT